MINIVPILLACLWSSIQVAEDECPSIRMKSVHPDLRGEVPEPFDSFPDAAAEGAGVGEAAVDEGADVGGRRHGEYHSNKYPS